MKTNKLDQVNPSKPPSSGEESTQGTTFLRGFNENIERIFNISKS